MKIRSSISMTFLAMICLLASVARVIAQQKEDANFTEKALAGKKLAIHLKKATFQDSLSELSRQLGLQVMGDGVPIIQKTDINFEGSAKTGLDLILSKFDYKWRIFKGKTLILTKAFHNPEERPQFNEAEIRQATEDSVRLAKTFPQSDKMFSETLGDLFKALPDSQKQSLMNGERVLMGDMPVICREMLVSSSCRDLLYGAVLDGEELLRMFKYLKTSELKITRIPVQFDLAGKDMGWAKGLVLNLKTPVSEPHSIFSLSTPVRDKESKP